jgi:hypothetical protein
MKRVLYSFLAMMCGWVACNLAFWAFGIRWLTEANCWDTITSNLLGIMIYTWLVIMIAWLFIFLPTDMLVASHSKLRKPVTAAICGFLASSGLVLAICLFAAFQNGLPRFFDTFFDVLISKESAPYFSGCCATGTVAAWARSFIGREKTGSPSS